MLTDSESRVVGPLVVAVGTAFFAAGLARLIWPAADGMIYLASLGIGFGFPLLASGMWSIRADMRRLGADLADREAERAVKLAAIVAPEAEPETPAEPDAAVSQSWRIMAHRFLAGAVRHGWTIRRMVDAGIVTWDGWLAMTDELVRLGVMVKSPRAGWALGWSWERWLTDCRALPWPDSEPPAVEISTTQQGNNANNSAPEGVEVIDGRATPV